MATFLISAFADEATNPMEGQIAALKRNDLHCIEPRNIGRTGLISMSDEELLEIKAQLDAAGISSPSFGSPIGKYPITEPFEAHLETFHRALEICKILGTKRMRVFSFFIPEGKHAEYRDEVMRRMSILLEEAKAAGVTLCHENEGGIYGETPEYVQDLLTTLPDLRAIYDAGNYVYYQQDPVKGLEATLPSLEYAHIKDCLYENSTIVPAGMGEAHIKEALQKIDAACDREIVLTVEPHLFHSVAHQQFDGKELHNKLIFATSDDAFDYAVTALKNILAEIGHPIVNGRG